MLKGISGQSLKCLKTPTECSNESQMSLSFFDHVLVRRVSFATVLLVISSSFDVHRQAWLYLKMTYLLDQVPTSDSIVKS